MANKTQQQVIELIEELKKLSTPSEVIATIHSDSVEEMKTCASDFKAHLYAPFEQGQSVNYYQFYYIVPRTEITIKVRSKAEFRQNKELVEI